MMTTGGKAARKRSTVVITATVPPLESEAELELWLAILAEGDLPEPTSRFRFAPKRRYRADLAYPAHMLLIEVEGGVTPYRDKNTGEMRDRGRHLTISGFTEDCRKYNLAALLGYRVLRFTPQMVREGDAVRVIREALGLGLGLGLETGRKGNAR